MDQPGSPNWIEILVIVLGCAGTIYGMLFVWAFVEVLWRRFFRLRPLQELYVSREAVDNFLETDVLWAKNRGFHYIGPYRLGSFGPTNVAVWENAEKSTFLYLYLDVSNPCYGFVTFFDDRIGLETGSLSQDDVFPDRPGHYVQIFSRAGLSELWRRHLEAETVLKDQGDATLTPCNPMFPWGNIRSDNGKNLLAPEVALPCSVRAQGRFLLRSWRAILFLPFTMVCRAKFRRRKSVRELIDTGSIPLPNELPSDYKKYAVDWPPNSVGEPQAIRVPVYTDENLVKPQVQGRFMGCVLPFLVSVAIVGTLFGLMFSAIYVPSATEDTKLLRKEFRENLFDLDDAQARKTADRIRQPYYREEAYAQLATQQMETEQFDACRETMKKIVGKYRRHHAPPIQWIMRGQLANALAASDRFDEVEAAIGKDSIRTDAAARIVPYFLAANKPDQALSILKKSHNENDLFFEVLRSIIVKFVQLGEFEKALDLAKNIPSNTANGWRNSTYREIVRESLVRNEIENARKVEKLFDIPRFRQQAETLFEIWEHERQSDHTETASDLKNSSGRPIGEPLSPRKFIESNVCATVISSRELSDYEKRADEFENNFRLILFAVKNDKRNEADAILEECRDYCRELPLPYSFYPYEDTYWNDKCLMLLFNAELFLGRFDDAEKTILRFGVTKTLDNAVLHERFSAAMLAADRREDSKKHAQTAWKFAKRLDGTIPTRDRNSYSGAHSCPQDVPEIVALPQLLESLELKAEADEARQRFAPPPQLRLPRFQ